jgi:ABC-type multidrug transport system fused ATPase/permease subunit
MFKILKKLFSFLDHGLKVSVVIIFALIIISMVIETFSIGLIIPAIAILNDSNIIENYPYYSKLVASLSPFKLVAQNNSENFTHADVIAGGMIIFLGVYLIKAIFIIFFTFKKGDYCFKLQNHITKKLINGYLNLPFSFFSNRNSSELIRNVGYENAVIANCVDTFLTLLTELFVLVGIILLLIYAQPLVALTALLIFGICIYYFNFFTKRKLADFGEIRKIYEEKRLNFLNQILGGIKEIKVYNTESEFVKSYLNTTKKVSRADMWQNIINASPRIWLELIAVLSFIILILMLLTQTKTQISIISTLGLFAGAAFRLLPSMHRGVNSFLKLKYYEPLIDKMHNELMMIDSAPINKVNEKISFSNNLNLNKISFSYPNSKNKTLNEVDLNIPKFSTVGLMGKTGSGKSTLANILIGLLSFSGGKIISDKKEIQDNRINFEEKVGYVPQNIFLTNDTIRKNIAFGVPEDEINNKKVFRSVNFAQLEEMVKNMPDGLNTLVGERGVRLSGGQIQRIGIARALYREPEFLVLDEATSSLDNDTENDFLNVIKNISGKKTIFFISHRPNVLKFCNVVYKLENGKLLKTN